MSSPSAIIDDLPITPQNYTIGLQMAEALIVQQAAGIYNACWLGVLLTVGVTLVLLSTPVQRQGAVFWIQCLAFSMALINSLLLICAVVFNLQQNFVTYNMDGILTRLESCEKVFEVFTPLVSDITLIFKVMAFYPPTIQSAMRRRFSPTLPLILLGIARLGTCSAVGYFYWRYDSAASTVSPEIIRSYGDVYHRVALGEFALQILFCSYASALLFRKIYLFAQLRAHSRSRTPMLRRKLRYLIESLAMTFILPVIAQIIALCASATQHGNVLFFASMTNVYLSTLLSVLATSWSTIRLTHIQHVRYATLTSGGGFSAARPTSRGSGGAEVPHDDCTPNQVELGAGSPNGKLGSRAGSPIKEGVHPLAAQGQVMPYRRSDALDQDDLADPHRATLLENLFDEGTENAGQATSMEMLTSVRQVHSTNDPNEVLPTRGTSGWRRGILRT